MYVVEEFLQYKDWFIDRKKGNFFQSQHKSQLSSPVAVTKYKTQQLYKNTKRIKYNRKENMQNTASTKEPLFC